MCIRVPYVNFALGLVLRKIGDILNTLYKLANQKPSMSFRDGISFSTELRTTLSRSYRRIGDLYRPLPIIKTSFPCPQRSPWPDRQSARAYLRFAWAGKILGGSAWADIGLLEQTSTSQVGSSESMVGSSQQGSRWSPLEWIEVRSSGLVRLRLAQANLKVGSSRWGFGRVRSSGQL